MNKARLFSVLMMSAFIIFSINSCVLKDKSMPKITISEPNSHAAAFICSGQSCERILVQNLRKANKSIHCAFYSLTLKSIINLLEEKSSAIETLIVLHNKSIHQGLMHNKFCIIDGKTVITGSYNPTKNRHRNNIIIITSPTIAHAYEKEFRELFAKTFASGEKTEVNSIQTNKTTISVFFCPEDDCEEAIYSELRKAKHSIYFMQYVFTSSKLATIIALKHAEGIDVKGIFERSRISPYSAFHFLSYQNISVFYDPFKEYIHHKVFIIDNETVITGSFNPTKSANTKNDENLLIIKDKDIANLYLKEFNYILSKI